MKCKKCGFKARDIDGMRRHYLKKHPQAMKQRRPRRVVAGRSMGHYCPHCGGAL